MTNLSKRFGLVIVILSSPAGVQRANELSSELPSVSYGLSETGRICNSWDFHPGCSILITLVTRNLAIIDVFVFIKWMQNMESNHERKPYESFGENQHLYKTAKGDDRI